MPFYEYRAVNKRGKDVVDIIEAATNTDALNKVRELGLYPIKVAETTKKSMPKKESGKIFFKYGAQSFYE